MLNFSVSDLNGTTTITATSEEKVVKKIDLPTVVFDALANISEPTPNKIVQQLIADAAGWKLNDAGRCPKAAALLERVTAGYGVFNGVISLMVATSSGKNRFFHFNESLTADSSAKMLTRQSKAAAPEAEGLATPVLEEAQDEDYNEDEAG
jgi:hypothetical protein